MHLSPAPSEGLDVFQLTLLDQLSHALIESLDLEHRLNAALRFFVPRLAEWAFVTMPDDHGEPSIAARLKSSADSTGAAEETTLVLPLRTPAEHVGNLHLRITALEPYATEVFLHACAERMAVAFHNARLFERAQRVSLTFQNAAIVSRLPQIPGYRFDAVYEAGRAEALVGGDWYDAFRLTDGRFVVSIGDVQGSGLHAAVAMVNVRQTLRGVAQLHADPVQMLQAADRTLREQHPDRFVTTFVAVIDPVTQVCAYANAGHPPPFLRLKDGSVQPLSAHGIPLGLPEFAQHIEAHDMHLPPHALLVLYTDGLTEAGRDVVEGEQKLTAALHEMGTADRPAHYLYERVLPGHSRDDVAILTLAIHAEAPVQRWRFDPQWHDAAGRVRDELSDELVIQGFGTTQVFNFETLFAELMANAVRYAPGTVEVLLETPPGAFILHVLDKGPGFQFSPRLPSDLFSERGRGLFLIAHLATEFNVERRPGGGSHARVVLMKPQRRGDL